MTMSRRFPLNTQGLNARDRGRLEKHLDGHVRYRGRLLTNRELYDERGIRVEAHPSARRTLDRYRMVTNEETGEYLQIPKMIYDAATAAETSGVADPERRLEDEIHPDWLDSPFAVQVKEAAKEGEAPW